MKLISIVTTAIGVTVWPFSAHASIIGTHLYSPHFAVNRDSPTHLQPSNVTPGVYWRSESGWTAGVVRNSHRRLAVYGGYTFESASKRFGLTVGLISGYQNKTFSGPSACGRQQLARPRVDRNTCTWTVGNTNAVFMPLIAPSWAWIEARPYLGGATPRVVLLGKGVNLAIEAEF